MLHPWPRWLLALAFAAVAVPSVACQSDAESDLAQEVVDCVARAKEGNEGYAWTTGCLDAAVAGDTAAEDFRQALDALGGMALDEGKREGANEQGPISYNGGWQAGLSAAQECAALPGGYFCDFIACVNPNSWWSDVILPADTPIECEEQFSFR